MNIPRHCENCSREFEAKLSNVVAGRGRFCSRICFDQHNRGAFSRRVWGNEGRSAPAPRPNMCIDDPVRTPTGRPAVVRALHNDGRIDIRYTDELRDPGCTLAAALLVKRPFKRPSAAVPRPLKGNQW